MELHEYIKKAKGELDKMYIQFVEGNENDPEMWPLEMGEEEWGDQELSARFDGASV